MPPTRAVWILDGTFYVDYINDCLAELVEEYPWLAAPPQQHRHGHIDWNWQDALRRTQFQMTSRRDALLNWIIREELEKCYYLGFNNHLQVAEFQHIHSKIKSRFDLSRQTFRYLLIPSFYGDVTSRFAERIDGTIIIELEFEQPTTRHHAPYPTRITPQFNSQYPRR